jgi:WD40 repeat protein
VSDSCTLIRSLDTGHVKIYDIDFSYDGTLMLTCGYDQTFKVWNISGINLSTTDPPLIGNVPTGDYAFTCKFSSTNLILIGNSSGRAKVYASTFTNSIIRTYTAGSGQVRSAEFFYCENSTRIVMGCDDGKGYWYNGTST